jgi:hypothetical protein
VHAPGRSCNRYMLLAAPWLRNLSKHLLRRASGTQMLSTCYAGSNQSTYNSPRIDQHPSLPALRTAALLGAADHCPAMPVTEADVGIRAWTNDLPGFTGIIKQRCAVPAYQAPAMQRIITCTCDGPTTHTIDASETARLRYSDFRVNEVTVHGEVVRLTDLRPISGRREPREAAAPTAASAADGAAEADPHAGAAQHPLSCWHAC